MKPIRLTKPRTSPGRLAQPPCSTYRWRPSPSGGRIRETVGGISGGAGSAASGRDVDPARQDGASPPGAAGVAGVRPTSGASNDVSGAWEVADGGPSAGAGDGFAGQQPARATTPTTPPRPPSYSAAAAAAAASGADPWAWVPRDQWASAAADAGVGEAERAAAEAAAVAAAAAAAAAAGTRPDGWAAASPAPPPPPPDAWGWDASAEAAARARLEVEEDWGALGGGGGSPGPGPFFPPRPGAGGWAGAAGPAAGPGGGPGPGGPPQPPPPRWTAARPGDGRGTAVGGEGGVPGPDSGSGTAPDPAAPPPDVVPLTALEADRVLPLAPQPDQVRAINADGAALVQRLGASLLLTLACIKAPAAAAGALTAPLWWPLARAAARNRGLRRGDPPVGLWRARVLEAGWQADRLGGGGGGRAASPPSPGGSVRLLVGDGSGATTLVVAPYERRHADIRVGDAAELVVLGRGGGGGGRPPGADPSAAFARGFRALPEAYLPETGQWVGAGYPYVDRRAAMALSVAVEEERGAGGEYWDDE